MRGERQGVGLCFCLEYLGGRAGLSRKVGVSCTDEIGLALWTMEEALC